MSPFEAYISAFSRCYPGKTVEFRRAPRHMGGGWWVVINGERGDHPLQLSDIESATKDFNRGKAIS